MNGVRLRRLKALRKSPRTFGELTKILKRSNGRPAVVSWPTDGTGDRNAVPFQELARGGFEAFRHRADKEQYKKFVQLKQLQKGARKMKCNNIKKEKKKKVEVAKAK